MVIKKNKFFLKLIEIVLDDQAGRDAIENRKKYDHINIVSYDQVNVPEDFKVKKKQSVRIDLSDGMENVFNDFDKTCKKHIKRTFKMDNLSFKMLDQDFNKTYAAYVDFEKANKRTPFAKTSLQDLYLFNAYDGDEVISAILCYKTFPSLKAHTIFSKRLAKMDKDKYKMISYATRRLVYEICRYAIENNYTQLDLGSVNFTDSSKSGITNFKMTFKPAIADEYHYIYQSPKFKLVNRIRKIFIK